jgi:hypothetical protein
MIEGSVFYVLLIWTAKLGGDVSPAMLLLDANDVIGIKYEPCQGTLSL